MSKQELYHEIFGSVLDRKEMTPYLLRNCDGYQTALKRAAVMMSNRGFDTRPGELTGHELERALVYVRQSIAYIDTVLLPFVENQIGLLAALGSPAEKLYHEQMRAIAGIHELLAPGDFRTLVEEDPRNLFLLSSSAKYPHLFHDYPKGALTVPRKWKMMACSILKMCHLIKSIEEDSQDIHDYACLGMFFESKGVRLTGMFDLDWTNPELIPEDESARRAYVKLAVFFGKLAESVSPCPERDCWVFDSGDGVQVDIAEIKARLKSPESMFAKLGKDAEEEAYNIRDILAITFILKNREHSLTLFHALQKRGVILQEYTASTSITQTLFDSPEDMIPAVRHLGENLMRSGGESNGYTESELKIITGDFYESLGKNAVRNPHTSDRHRKFQCKIKFSVPVHRDEATGDILVPGTEAFAERTSKRIRTQQHSLPVELRISDSKSWVESEQTGEAHHDAYKCRQLVALMNRLFSPLFSFPADAEAQFRADQERLFS